MLKSLFQKGNFRKGIEDKKM